MVPEVPGCANSKTKRQTGVEDNKKRTEQSSAKSLRGLTLVHSRKPEEQERRTFLEKGLKTY